MIIIVTINNYLFKAPVFYGFRNPLSIPVSEFPLCPALILLASITLGSVLCPQGFPLHLLQNNARD